MAYPTLIYNASSGNDTGASGSNAPATAKTNTTESQTISTAGTTTLTFSGTVDLTGVLDDDSDVIWVNTSSGRKLYRITAFTGGVSTCTALTISTAASTTQSGLSWAIGGKRQTINSDIPYWSAGWTAELEAGTYNTTTPVISSGDTTDGPVTLRAASGTSPIVDGTTGTHHPLRLTGGIIKLRGIKFIAAAARNCVDITTSAVNLAISDCELDYQATGSKGIACATDLRADIRRNYFNGGANGVDGFDQTSSRCNLVIADNRFTSGDYGISISGVASYSSVTITGNIFDNQDADGVSIEDVDLYSVVIDGNSFYNPASDGIAVTPAINSVQSICMHYNIFVSCGNYGINAPSNADFVMGGDYNAYYSNTAGDRNNISAGSNDVTLTGDPFTNAASSDFSLNNTAGAGAACRAVYPGASKDGTNTSYRDLGALQHQDSGGGGGTTGRQGLHAIGSGAV